MMSWAMLVDGLNLRLHDVPRCPEPLATFLRHLRSGEAADGPNSGHCGRGSPQDVPLAQPRRQRDVAYEHRTFHARARS